MVCSNLKFGTSHNFPIFRKKTISYNYCQKQAQIIRLNFILFKHMVSIYKLSENHYIGPTELKYSRSIVCTDTIK